MGKILIIKGADFSECAIDNVKYIKLEWTYDIVGGQPRTFTDNHVIPVGSTVGFIDNTLYSKYSFAISKCSVEDALLAKGENDIGNGQWDSSYSGSAYITSSIITNKIHYYIFLKKNDNSAFSTSDKNEISNNFKIKIV